MVDAVNAGAAAAGGADSGAGAGSGGNGAADISSLSDGEVLERASLETTDAGAALPADTGKEAGKEAATETDVNLAALEEGQPEWLAKVTDQAAKDEIGKLLARDKKFTEKFKDEADLEEFFKDLPGGREQVTALQTLSKEVTELDGHIEANTPEGNGIVAERYLGMAPDGGVGLFRAAAQHLAKANPESWGAISNELLNSTLKAAGIGTDAPGLLSAISEMREAIAKDDGEAFGKAAGKLLGTPKADAAAVDPRLSKAQDAEKAARTAERSAKVTIWESNVKSTVEGSQQHVRQAIGTALATKDTQGRPLIPASIPEQSRKDLSERIFKEIDQQLGADSWLISQINSLVGSRTGDKHNLAATKEHFDKAASMSKAAADRLLPSVVRKVVSSWARELSLVNADQRERAKGGPARKDVGGSAPPSNGRKTLSAADIVGPNAKSDKDLLDSTLN